MMKLRLAITLTSAVLAAWGAAVPAVAKVSGTYSGEAVHPNPLIPGSEPLDEPYTTNFVVTVVRKGAGNRISNVYASVRMWCAADQTIRDVVVTKTWTRSMPRLRSSGAFTIRRQGVTIEGKVAKARAEGTLRASADGCAIDGVRFSAARRSTDW